jgi:hypothetical protein
MFSIGVDLYPARLAATGLPLLPNQDFSRLGFPRLLNLWPGRAATV